MFNRIILSIIQQYHNTGDVRQFIWRITSARNWQKDCVATFHINQRKWSCAAIKLNKLHWNKQVVSFTGISCRNSFNNYLLMSLVLWLFYMAILIVYTAMCVSRYTDLKHIQIFLFSSICLMKLCPFTVIWIC